MGLFNDPNDPGGCVEIGLIGCFVAFVVVAVAAISAVVKAFG